MQHGEAVATKASERYLLSEMSEPERFAFEAHYFDCEDCAEDVRAGFALVHGVKAVGLEDAALSPAPVKVCLTPRRNWFSWLSPASAVPTFAALAVGCFAAWQSFVLVPSLRWASTPQAFAPTVLRAAARGEEQALDIRPGQSISLLSLDVNSAEPGTALTYEVLAPGGGKRQSGCTVAPPAGSPLIVVLPISALGESGAWALVLRDKQGVEIARYPFSVHSN